MNTGFHVTRVLVDLPELEDLNLHYQAIRIFHLL